MLNEKCGIFAIYGPNIDCAHLTYFGLIALQHRGQESAGIAVNNNRDIHFIKDDGLVNDVFNEENLGTLKGDMAVGHVRYSTAGGMGAEKAQPLVFKYKKGNIAIAHNGNVCNAAELKEKYDLDGAIYQTDSDTELIAYTIAKERINASSIEEAIDRSMDILKGAYSIVVMSPRKLIAARDPWGFRPLCIGKLGDAIIFASETCALDSIDAEFVREIEPGEIIVVEDGKMTSFTKHCKKTKPSLCIFEYIYFARPDSTIHGQFVESSRRLAGKYLAIQHPVEADLVAGVPDSGVPAAMGYAEESGLPYIPILLKNRYIGRTFIQPTQELRERAVKMKLNPLKQYVEGKRIVLVDDSIVRGTTTRRLVALLKNAGAKEIHIRISSPPFMYPCYFGTDIPSQDELVAPSRTVDQIRDMIGADSLGYLDEKYLTNLVPDLNMGGYCDACFSGKYVVK